VPGEVRASRGVVGSGYRPLRDVVLKMVRDRIADGTLRPGARIFEEDIAERLGVSRGPVREALGRLQEQGLIVTVANRGSFVVELAPDDIRELYELRLALESLAVRRMMARRNPRDVKRLAACLGTMRRAAARGDLRRLLEADLAFHRAIWQAAGQRFLAQALQRLEGPLQVLMSVQNRAYVDLAEDVRDQEEVLSAISSGDPDRAVVAMSRHIEDAARMTLAAVAALPPAPARPQTRRATAATGSR